MNLSEFKLFIVLAIKNIFLYPHAEFAPLFFGFEKIIQKNRLFVHMDFLVANFFALNNIYIYLEFKFKFDILLVQPS